MGADVVLHFHVEAYTPETIPMARLAEYLGELAKLLGEQKSVHFVRLDPGSTDIVHKVEREAAPRAVERAISARTGNAPVEAIRAYHKINEMLGADNGTGRLMYEGGAQIIEFPGANRPPAEYGAISERGSLDGRLIKIGGKRDLVPLTLQRGAIDYSHIYATRAKAEELGKVLFRPVRLFGEGRWFRTAKGEWVLDRFRVDDFKELDRQPLSRALAELRGLARDEWSQTSLDDLDELRRGEMH